MELFIENINHTGEGVARHAGKVVFVAYAIPGETVRVELTEEKKHYCRGIVKDIITESPYRVEAKCPHYYHCGGCSFQHIEYKEQLLLKQKIMEDILKRMAGVDSLIKPVIGMKEPWYYRNKVVWHLTQEGNSKKIGFYRFRSRQLVEIDHCPLLLPKLNKVSLLIKEMLSEVKVRNNSYDSSIMVRQSNQQDGMMLIFTNCSVGEKLLRKLEGEFISQLSSILPEILGYVSCNPATLARDVKQFLANGYQLVEVQPIDMFPQTNNIENVVLLHKE